jgi:hypothetical protein
MVPFPLAGAVFAVRGLLNFAFPLTDKCAEFAALQH